MVVARETTQGTYTADFCRIKYDIEYFIEIFILLCADVLVGSIYLCFVTFLVSCGSECIAVFWRWRLHGDSLYSRAYNQADHIICNVSALEWRDRFLYYLLNKFWNDGQLQTQVYYCIHQNGKIISKRKRILHIWQHIRQINSLLKNNV